MASSFAVVMCLAFANQIIARIDKVVSDRHIGQFVISDRLFFFIPDPDQIQSLS